MYVNMNVTFAGYPGLDMFRISAVVDNFLGLETEINLSLSCSVSVHVLAPYETTSRMNVL